jgi:hypothetical protein
MASNGKTPVEAVSEAVGEGQRVCEFCGQPLIGRRPLARFCSAPCRKRAHEARGAQQRAADAEAERIAERQDAEAHLVELHARRVALAGGASDSMIGAELATIRSMIRCAQHRLLERDAEEDAA